MNRIPIVVGVTGHRKLRLEDYPLLKEKVKIELKKIKNLVPNSDLVLLDSLALGGDTICAEVAMGLGYEIEVPLPFEIDEYRKDFDEENLKVFNEQIKKSKKVYELNKISDLSNRDDGYKDAGLYIATHSHIIIALWDGEKGKPDGCGSAEFVDYVREGFDPSLVIPTPFISIIHISAIREGKQGEAGIVKYYERKDGDMKSLLKNTDNFNRDANRKELKEYDLIERHDNEVINDIHALYKKADSLSNHYQRKYLSTLRICSILGVGVILSLLFYNQTDIFWLLILYAAFPIVSKIVVEFANRGKYLERYIETRSLAESCRVQLFALLSGINRSVAYAYPWTIREDNDWIIKAMMSKLSFDKNFKANKEEARKFIEEQLTYHTKALAKEDKNNKKAKRSTKIMDYVTIVNYLLVALAVFSGISMFMEQLFVIGTYSFTYNSLFKLSLGVVSAIATLAKNYYGKLSLSRKVEDHKRYIELYTEALKRIDNNNEQYIWELIREELNENSSWRSYMKSNEPSVIIK